MKIDHIKTSPSQFGPGYGASPEQTSLSLVSNPSWSIQMFEPAIDVNQPRLIPNVW